MKKKTVISLLCAGALTVGAFTGLTGFADKDDEQKIIQCSQQRIRTV